MSEQAASEITHWRHTLTDCGTMSARSVDFSYARSLSGEQEGSLAASGETAVSIQVRDLVELVDLLVEVVDLLVQLIAAHSTQHTQENHERAKGASAQDGCIPRTSGGVRPKTSS